MPELPPKVPSAAETFASLDWGDLWPEAHMVSVCHFLRGSMTLKVPSSFRHVLPQRLWSSPYTGCWKNNTLDVIHHQITEFCVIVVGLMGYDICNGVNIEDPKRFANGSTRNLTFYCSKIMNKLSIFRGCWRSIMVLDKFNIILPIISRNGNLYPVICYF